MTALSKSVENIDIDPEDVAEFFLAFANSVGDKITNLKLQKLVYYADAWYLANHGKSLFKEDFEAWIHGPVLFSLYRKYKKYGCEPIDSPKTLSDLSKEEKIPKRLFDFLEEVARVYMTYQAYQLELATHNEKPWQEARRNLSIKEKSNEPISKRVMMDFYKKILNEKRKSSSS